MERKKRIPKRRFREFLEAGEWKYSKASNVFESISDKNHAELPVLSATQDKGMVLRDINGINIQHDEKSELTYKRVLPGQFVIHLRSFQGGFAHSNVEGITSPAYTVMDFKNNEHNDYFWKYIFTSEEFIKRLETVTYGIRDGRSISYDDFSTLSFVYPDKNEQKKIGDFCRRLDTLISLHQQKLAKLKDLKQAYLTEMFPAPGEKRPRRRFKGFSGDWEKKCLADMVDGFDYGLNAAAKRYDGENKYIRITDIDDSTHLFNTDDLTSPDCNLEKASISILQEGDILFARTGASVGKTYLYRQLDGKVFFAGFLIRATVKKCYSAGFIFQNTLTNLYKEYIGVTSQRSGQPGVNAQEYGQYEFWVPSLNEQMLIARFLEKIDDNFSIETKVISKLQSLKQAYLSELFV